MIEIASDFSQVPEVGIQTQLKINIENADFLGNKTNMLDSLNLKSLQHNFLFSPGLVLLLVPTIKLIIISSQKQRVKNERRKGKRKSN